MNNNQNINIEEKRRIFLEELDKIEPNVLKFEQFSGPGIKRKIQRLIYTPNIYLQYIFWKIFRNFFNDKKIKLFWGKEFLLNIKDLEASRIIFLRTLMNEAELKLARFFIKNLKKDDVFYDIGANYGFYSCLAAEFCKEVHSFEPVPEIFNYLKKNTAEYFNVFLNNLAISDKEGFIDIYRDEKSSGLSTINENILDREGFILGNKEKIQSITLDEYIKTHNKPSILKIDVEGAESLVLEGGKEFFVNKFPIIAMEVCSKENKGEISMEAVEKLRNLGYKFYLINKKGELEKVDGDLLVIIEKEDMSFDNFIFKK